jgi:hypothetical protein
MTFLLWAKFSLYRLSATSPIVISTYPPPHLACGADYAYSGPHSNETKVAASMTPAAALTRAFSILA